VEVGSRKRRSIGAYTLSRNVVRVPTAAVLHIHRCHGYFNSLQLLKWFQAHDWVSTEHFTASVAFAGASPLQVGQKLPIEGKKNPVALGILLFANVNFAVNEAHDSIPEFLMDYCLYGISIDHDSLV